MNNGVADSLMSDEDCFTFWQKAELNDNGCIELQVRVFNPVWDTLQCIKNTPDKTRMSKSPTVPVRRSPRLNGKGVTTTAKKGNLFGDAGSSSTKPVVLDNDEDIQMGAAQDEDIEQRKDDEDIEQRQGDEDIEHVDAFNHDYWVNQAMLDRELGATQADDYVIELENIFDDECHPVEDPNISQIYDSDEDSDCMENDAEEDNVDSNDDAREDSGDSSDEGNVENKDDDLDEVIEQGDKGKHNRGTAEMKDDDPEWFKNFKAERAVFFPEEEVIKEKEEKLFPEQEHDEPLDPSQMVVGTLFPNRKAFQRPSSPPAQ